VTFGFEDHSQLLLRSTGIGGDQNFHNTLIYNNFVQN
jgi:hypothetical protein